MILYGAPHFEHSRLDDKRSIIASSATSRESTLSIFTPDSVNAYRHCYALAYLINIFPNPKIVSYFKSYSIQFNNDALATSTMVQWLWRSRLRCGQEIWLYLPSSRMRKLLYKWVKDVTGNVDCIDEWE